VPGDYHRSRPACEGGPAAADAAREIAAAVRRGDEPGAEQALSSYLARSAAGPAPAHPAEVPAALRALVMELAEMAADALD
jgi:hypothetical protein